MNHFTDVVVCININMHIVYKKSRSHVRYILPHLENERLMDTIRNRDDQDGLLK